MAGLECSSTATSGADRKLHFTSLLFQVWRLDFGIFEGMPKLRPIIRRSLML